MFIYNIRRVEKAKAHTGKRRTYMKRLIPILLIFALALALGGCGDFAPDLI